MKRLADGIEEAIKINLPGRRIQKIKDRGVWERHIFEVTLDGNETIFFKIQVSDWNMTGFEEKGVRLFRENGFPMPKILSVDVSREILPHPYIIQEWRGGTQLGALLKEVDEPEAERIYEALGHFYRRMHYIRSERSELLVPIPGASHPNEFMYQAEIVGGSCKKALEKGFINQNTNNRTVALWKKNLGYLKDHQPALINTSPFLWSIYLERDGYGWTVVKISPMSELMWWDVAYNLAFLKHPPFGRESASRRQAFLRAYGAEPERKRMLLYLVMQRFCAAMGIYKAPKEIYNEDWATHCLVDIYKILDEIE